jgi:hypothetical protein
MDRNRDFSKKNPPTISSIKSPILLSSIPGLSLAKGEKWE